MVDVEKCPYIEYKIQGISGIVAKEEKAFCVKDDLIIQIELKQEGLEITGLKVQLKEDSIIDEQVKQTIRRKIERFFSELIWKSECLCEYCGFSIQIARKPNMSLAVHW